MRSPRVGDKVPAGRIFQRFDTLCRSRSSGAVLCADRVLGRGDLIGARGDRHLALADDAAARVRVNLEEYLEKGIVK